MTIELSVILSLAGLIALTLFLYLRRSSQEHKSFMADLDDLSGDDSAVIEMAEDEDGRFYPDLLATTMAEKEPPDGAPLVFVNAQPIRLSGRREPLQIESERTS